MQNRLLDFFPHDTYPENLVPPSGKLSTICMTYETMKHADITAHEGMVSENFSDKNVEAYMRMNGLNSEAIQSTIKCAGNCKIFAVIEVDVENDPDEFHAILENETAYPLLFQRWTYPAVWARGVKLSQHVDVVMHSLFLGIVKTCIK